MPVKPSLWVGGRCCCSSEAQGLGRERGEEDGEGEEGLQPEPGPGSLPPETRPIPPCLILTSYTQDLLHALV